MGISTKSAVPLGLLVALAAGMFLESKVRLFDADDRVEPAPGPGPEILYWVAPMDPEYRRNEPGKSPMGMDLVPVYAADSASGEVTIAPEVQQNIGVRTQRAERGRLWQKVEATGRVGLNQELVAHVHVRTAGWVQSLPIVFCWCDRDLSASFSSP